MKENTRKLVDTVSRKGLLETLIHILNMMYDITSSFLKIFFLKIRGYNIEYSVLLRGGNFFFQSTKNAINISRNTIIGKNTRISGGGSGKVYIGKNVLIDDCTFIMAHERIEIGKDTKIAAFCFITDFNHKYEDKKLTVVDQGYETKPVIIGDNVWLGTHVVILPGVRIGSGSVVGAGSIVTHNIPVNSVAVGNPARVIRQIVR